MYQIVLFAHLLGVATVLVALIYSIVVLARHSKPSKFMTTLEGIGFILLLSAGIFLWLKFWLDAFYLWLLGAIIGYALILATTLILKKRLFKDKADEPMLFDVIGRLGAVTFTLFMMVQKFHGWDLLVTFILFAATTGLLMWATLNPRRRLLGSLVGIVLVVTALGFWRLEVSKLPEQFSIMDTMDVEAAHAERLQGESHDAHNMNMSANPISVVSLVEKNNAALIHAVTLTAEEKDITVDGQTIHAWTYNGQVPGPTIEAMVGDRLQVKLINKLPVPTTIHWHGVVLPNAEDGVAGVTQDAVQPGAEFTYDFVVTQPGAYWFHSHEDPDVQVNRGLFGALIVHQANAPEGLDPVAVIHKFDGKTLAVNGETSPAPIDVTPGKLVRLHVINTNSTPTLITGKGIPFKVTMFDAGYVHEPQELTNTNYLMPGAGRVELSFTVLEHQEFDLYVGDKLMRFKTSDSSPVAIDEQGAAKSLDLTNYGTPDSATELPDPTIRWKLHLGEYFGAFDGEFGHLFPINGGLFPYGPMLMVKEGDIGEVIFLNQSNEDHPMHLHGHIFELMAIDNQKVTGAPLMMDTVNVRPHHQVTIRFRADNPGLWMSHCHNLEHGANGMDLMVAYEGVTTPYLIGGSAKNKPE